MKLLIYGASAVVVLAFGGYFFFKWIVFSEFGIKIAPEKSGHYWKNGKEIRYSTSNGVSTAGARSIPGADAESFEVIARVVARDKNRAYIGDQVFKTVDHKSLESLWGDYFRDSQNVYFSSKKLNGALPDTEWIQAVDDPKHNWLISKEQSFFQGNLAKGLKSTEVKVLEESLYSINQNLVFYGSSLLGGADAQSFKLVQRHGAVLYAFDDKNVFIENRKVEPADPKTFEYIENSSSRYFKDKKNVYYTSTSDNKFSVNVVVGADPESFHVKKVGDTFQFDKNHLYSFGLKVEGSDAKTYEELNHAFSKDKNNIYRYGNLLVDVDRELFQKDKIKELESLENGKLYFLERNYPKILKVTLAARDQIEELGNNYSRYQGRIFSQGNLIEGADSNSFEVLGTNMAKDRNNIYYYDHVVTNVELSSFKYREDLSFSKPDENGSVSLIDE